jgi:hypothetical protein
MSIAPITIEGTTQSQISLWGVGDEAIATLLGMLLATIVGVWTVRRTLRPIARQLYVATFLEFTGRYDSIFVALSEANSQAKAQTHADPAGDGRRAHEAETARLRYFNLCSEEYFLFTRKFIDRKTWRYWRSGIVRRMSETETRELWANVQGQYNKEFVEEMDRVIADSKAQ